MHPASIRENSELGRSMCIFTRHQVSVENALNVNGSVGSRGKLLMLFKLNAASGMLTSTSAVMFQLQLLPTTVGGVGGVGSAGGVGGAVVLLVGVAGTIRTV